MTQDTQKLACVRMKVEDVVENIKREGVASIVCAIWSVARAGSRLCLFRNSIVNELARSEQGSCPHLTRCSMLRVGLVLNDWRSMGRLYAPKTLAEKHGHGRSTYLDLY
jgi:hypothetical protein